ncbi:MAG: hypothetical protein AB8B55_20210 [Mariniblastus sp.]
MRSFSTRATLLILFAYLTTSLVASTVSAGDVFDDKDLWRASVCGNVIGTDFGSVVDFAGNSLPDDFSGEIPTPQNLSYGVVSQEGNALGIRALSTNGSVGFVADFARSVDIDINPGLDPVEGVCFRVLQLDSIYKFYDGDTLVETQVAEYDATLTFDDAPAYWGWTNTEGLNITRIEISGTEESNFAIVIEGEISFGGNCSPSPEESLEEIIASLEAIGPTGCYFDDLRIDLATYFLGSAANPAFFNEDGSLNDNGCLFFWYAKKATSLLSRVNGNADVDQAQMDIQAVLNSIVEGELAAAVAAGGDAYSIATAEDFLLQAEMFAAAGDYKRAARKSKWAWVFARCSY